MTLSTTLIDKLLTFNTLNGESHEIIKLDVSPKRKIPRPPPALKFSNINRRNCKRVVPMKVLVLGLCRTGKESLRKASIQLGYDNTYHGYEASMENPRDCEMWMDAFRAKYEGIGKPFGREEWDMLLGHCQAVCDVPAACFAQELMEAYPEAKIILTNRDVDSWYLSVLTTLHKATNSPLTHIVSFLSYLTFSPSRNTHPTFHYALHDYFSYDFEKNRKTVYKSHYNRIRSLASESGTPLLEYRIEEGWGSLCQFLGCEVPEMEFPRGNEMKEIRRRMRVLLGREARRLVGLVGVLGIMVVGWWVLGVLRFGWESRR